jgi:hypothetical protein
MSKSFRAHQVYDSDFASNFSLDDAESVHQVLQTPWCGNQKACDPRQPVREDCGLNEQFNREYEAVRSSRESSVRIVRVETSEHEAFVFNFVDVDSGESREWFDEVVSAYQFAMYLGAAVQTPVFGDGWWAIQPYDGDPVGEVIDQQSRAQTPHGLTNRVCWDAARMTIVGHREFGSSSVLFGEDGTYRYGSMELAGNTIASLFHLYVTEANDLMRNVSGSSNAFRKYTYAVQCLAEHIDDHEFLDAFMNDTIQENIGFCRLLFAQFFDGMFADDVSKRLPVPMECFIPDPEVITPIVDAGDRRTTDSRGGDSDV